MTKSITFSKLTTPPADIKNPYVAIKNQSSQAYEELKFLEKQEPHIDALVLEDGMDAKEQATIIASARKWSSFDLIRTINTLSLPPLPSASAGSGRIARDNTWVDLRQVIPEDLAPVIAEAYRQIGKQNDNESDLAYVARLNSALPAGYNFEISSQETNPGVLSLTLSAGGLVISGVILTAALVEGAALAIVVAAGYTLAVSLNDVLGKVGEVLFDTQRYPLEALLIKAGVSPENAASTQIAVGLSTIFTGIYSGQVLSGLGHVREAAKLEEAAHAARVTIAAEAAASTQPGAIAAAEKAVAMTVAEAGAAAKVVQGASHGDEGAIIVNINRASQASKVSGAVAKFSDDSAFVLEQLFSNPKNFEYSAVAKLEWASQSRAERLADTFRPFDGISYAVLKNLSTAIDELVVAKQSGAAIPSEFLRFGGSWDELIAKSCAGFEQCGSLFFKIYSGGRARVMEQYSELDELMLLRNYSQTKIKWGRYSTDEVIKQVDKVSAGRAH